MNRFKEMIEDMKQGVLEGMSKEEKTKWLQELQSAHISSIMKELREGNYIQKTVGEV